MPGPARPGRFGPVAALAKACHPEPTVAVTVFAVVVALASGRSAAGAASVGVAVLFGQLSVGWSNDWLDAERDLRSFRRDKPLVSGGLRPAVVRRAALVAAVAVVPTSAFSGAPGALAHIGAVAVAWSYNAKLKATLLSVVPYAVSFGLLVAFVSLGLPHHPGRRGGPWLRAASSVAARTLPM